MGMSEESKDKLLDFIEDHRLLIIIGFVALIALIAIGVGVKVKKDKEIQAEIDRQLEEARLAELESQNTIPEVESEIIQPRGEYEVSLGLDKDKNKDERIQIKPQVQQEEVVEENVQTEPNYPPEVSVFGFQEIPTTGLNANLFQNYLSKVSLSSFDSKWGSALTYDDMVSSKKILVGYEKDRAEDDTDAGDLQSVAWVTRNIDTLSKNDALKFVDLHVIGHLSDDHVAVLCTYELYAAEHLKNMLVMFEDISGTLSIDDFKSGDIFSALVYAHNMKVATVNGETVLLVQYNTFK